VLQKPAGRMIMLPEELCFTVEYEKYILAPAAYSNCPFPSIKKEIRIKIPGVTHVPGGEIKASVLKSNNCEYDGGKNNIACFDFMKVGKVLRVRRRIPGDRFQPLGLPGLKKLNTFMIDARIPRAWRENIPIVASEKQIIWVTGWRIDERVKVTGTTKQVLCLEYRAAES
jgi:tRNA(Ile)-lysidine synthase